MLGGEASTTEYTVAMANGSHYEVPWEFYGVVHVAWAADGAGELQVTEDTQD